MKVSTSFGVVLRRDNFGEADKLITLFTRDQGKIKVLAKGIRRIKSRRASHLELFNSVTVTLYQGIKWPIVSGAKEKKLLSTAKTDLKKAAYLFYIAEVVERLLPENQSHPDVYALLTSALLDLETCSNEEVREKVKEFVIALLWLLGYLPRGQYPELGVTALVEEILEHRIKSVSFIDKI